MLEDLSDTIRILSSSFQAYREFQFKLLFSAHGNKLILIKATDATYPFYSGILL